MASRLWRETKQVRCTGQGPWPTGSHVALRGPRDHLTSEITTTSEFSRKNKNMEFFVKMIM